MPEDVVSVAVWLPTTEGYFDQRVLVGVDTGEGEPSILSSVVDIMYGFSPELTLSALITGAYDHVCKTSMSFVRTGAL